MTIRPAHAASTRPLVVVGSGGHGRVVVDAARAAGRAVVGFSDADPALRGETVLGVAVLATTVDETVALCRAEGAEVVLAVGDNRRRASLHDELAGRGVDLGSVLHPTAVIAASASLGRGTVVFAGVIVNAGAMIGEDVILNTGARVDHDARIGAHAHLSPGVTLGGTVTVGEGAHLGVGVSVRNDTTIGAWTTVGVGAAVVADLPAGVVAHGVPARVIRPA